MNQYRYFNRISMLLLFFVLILSLAGCAGQADGITDAGKEDAGHGKEAELGQDREEQSANDGTPRPEDAETEQQEPVTEYPILTEMNSRWVDYVMESEGIYCVYVDGRYSFLTEAGEEITPFTYPEASPFSEGLACVCLDGKYGYIDTNGDTALEFIYDYATPFVEGLAYFATGDSYGFMDKNGEPVFYLDCDSVSSFQEGLAYFSLDGKYGYIDRTGAVVIEPVYDDAYYFDQGMAKVRIGGSYGMIDCQGREILPVDYDWVDFVHGYLLAGTDEGSVCLGPDGKGGWRLLLEGDSVYPWECGERTFLEYDIDGKKGLADENGRVLFECYDDYINPLADTGYVFVQVYGEETTEYGIRDLQGNLVVPFGEYDYIHSYGSDASVGLLKVEKDGMCGFLALEDMTLKIPAVWQNVGSFSQSGHYTWGKMHDKYGIIDTEGNLIYPVEYEEATVFENDSVALWKNGVVSLYDAGGGLLYQARDCRNITLTGECYEVRLKNGIRYLSLDGKRVGAEYFSYITNVQTNLLVARSDDRDKNDIIIKTGEADKPVAEIDGAILKNAITPRLEPFYQLFLGRMSGESEDGAEALGTLGTEIGECSRPLFRLYAVKGCEEPLLYYYEEPYVYVGFPLSESGFYQLQEGRAVEIVSGYECGGSMRGDYATLWYDKETGDVLPGLYGNWGGFGGYSSGRHIYRNEGNSFEDSVSFYSTTMFYVGAVPSDIKKTPELVYGADGQPYPVDTLPAEQDDPGYYEHESTYYEVDGKYVTVERYQEERNRYEELYCVWY